MKNNVAIQSLENSILELDKRKKSAMEAAAQPYDKEIAELKNAIVVLKGVKHKLLLIDEPDLKIQPTTIIKKKGRPFKIKEKSSYPLGASVLDRFLFVLKEANYFLDITEIAQRVNRYEPGTLIEDLKTQFGKHVNVYREKGLIVTQKIEGGKYIFYGLPTWVKNGEVKSEYINMLM